MENSSSCCCLSQFAMRQVMWWLMCHSLQSQFPSHIQSKVCQPKELFGICAGWVLWQFSFSSWITLLWLQSSRTWLFLCSQILLSWWEYLWVELVGNSCACLILTVLEPFFNAAASQFILGQQIPVTLWLSLAPIVLGKVTRFLKNPAATLHCLCCFLCRQ
jgi:hypothetical protein